MWQFVSEGPWSRRRKHQAVVWEDKIVLLGGFDGEMGFDLNDVWSWSRNIWTEICNRSEWSGRDGHCALVFQKAIYILGGTDDPYNCRNDIWRSDNGGIEWHQICASAPWPERWQHAACVHEGKIFVMGGWGDSYLNDVWSSANGVDWNIVCKNAPWSARMFLSAITFNGALYVIGGHDGRQQLSDVWVSIDGISWKQVCQSAQWEGRQGHACVAHNGYVYIMGGYGPNAKRFNDLWKSDDCSHWTLVSRYSTWSPRQGHAAVLMMNSIYILGGFDEAGCSNNMYCLSLTNLAGCSNKSANQRIRKANLTWYNSQIEIPSILGTCDRISDFQKKCLHTNTLLRAINDVSRISRSTRDYYGNFEENKIGTQLFDSASLMSSLEHNLPLTKKIDSSIASLENMFENNPRDYFIECMAKVSVSLQNIEIENSTVSSLHLREIMDNTSNIILYLQLKIRSAAGKNDLLLVEQFVADRTKLALRQVELSSQLMQHVLKVRQLQSKRNGYLEHASARIGSFCFICGSIFCFPTFITDRDDNCSQYSCLEFEKNASGLNLEFVSASQDFNTAMNTFSAAVVQRAKFSTDISFWITDYSNNKDKIKWDITHSPQPLYEHLVVKFQCAEQNVERCVMAINSVVEDELSIILGRNAYSSSVFKRATIDAHLSIKSVMNQNRLAILEQSLEEIIIQKRCAFALCLMQSDEIRKRCDVIVAVNTKKEDELVRLEGERIDKRSALEKAILQASRRHGAPSRRQVGKIPSEFSSFCTNNEDLHAVVSSSVSPCLIENEIEALHVLLETAENAVKEARRSIRAWYRELRKLATEFIPELFNLIPDLQTPGSILGDGGFAENAKVPHRLLDDYVSLIPFNPDADAISQTSRHVILKATYDGEDVVLKGFFMHDIEQRKGFETELSILSRLRNDSFICPCAIVEGSAMTKSMENISFEGTVFIEYPYYKNGNLSTWLKQDRKLWEMQSVARQVLYGLMYLHDHGIIHKDIKPSNILMHEDGRVVLADFELSREIKLASGILEDISSTSRAGTKGFMSPEVEADGHALFASDMYSFGVLLYYMHFPQNIAGLVPGDPRIPENNNIELTDLIRRLLSISPSARPTARSTLMHPYFRSTFVEKLMQDGEMVEQDRKLDAVRHLVYRVKGENRTNIESLVINRQTLVGDLLTYFEEMPLGRMKACLRVTFANELGIDEGGLLSEMFAIFFDCIFQSDLFESGDAVSRSSAPVPHNSSIETSNLVKKMYSSEFESNDFSPSIEYCNNEIVLPAVNNDCSINLGKFKAFGRILVKTLYEGRRAGSRLCQSVFKFITGTLPNMRDLRMYDPQTARSLQWILATEKVEDFGLHFESVDAPNLGPVTDLNKTDFVSRKIRSIMVDRRESCLLAIKTGFIEALHALSEDAAPFMSLLSHTDWCILLCGDTALNSQHVISVLKFSGFAKKSFIPEWLKSILLSFSEDYLRKFLVFITGSPTLPGVGANRFEINVRCQSHSGALPVAHTCFLHLDIPDYKDKITLQSKLVYAITSSQGFEIV